MVANVCSSGMRPTTFQRSSVDRSSKPWKLCFVCGCCVATCWSTAVSESGRNGAHASAEGGAATLAVARLSPSRDTFGSNE